MFAIFNKETKKTMQILHFPLFFSRIILFSTFRHLSLDLRYKTYSGLVLIFMDHYIDHSQYCIIIHTSCNCSIVTTFSLASPMFAFVVFVTLFLLASHRLEPLNPKNAAQSEKVAYPDRRLTGPNVKMTTVLLLVLLIAASA